ncbi:peptidoglycan-binding protein [Sediminibacillus massiliensis]|uniref:peptidoglycan-binding protein n=1 Tax=Sediminibacillus massiliensis TaxID=1926277 RepID=UPI0009887E9F|nr:peptidoglycan-binding protein [Sediminibacillus massiliensis]
MAYNFEKLPQLVDKREGLPEKGEYSKRIKLITTRVWHHSLTKKNLSGSTAYGFAKYHVENLGWPGCGYAFVIEPRNVIQTPKGPRARIVYVHDINRRTYHVGNSNQFALGICVAGDYRTDEMDEATLASIDELQQALVDDKIGSQDRSHNEMPGYPWKACCVFNYMEAFKFLDSNVKQAPLPDEYVIQEGDTFWSIANGIEGLNVDDLIKINPDVDYSKLKVGQKIKLAAAKREPAPKTQTKSQTTSWKGYYSKGDTGSEVKAKQKRLMELGFDLPVYGADGSFGDETEEAVMDFQRARGLQVDGIIGPNTMAELKKDNPKPKYGNSIVPYPGYPIERGSRGKEVARVQRAVGVKPDERFGPITERAVKAYQRRHGLVDDGRVGPKTWAVMF